MNTTNKTAFNKSKPIKINSQYPQKVKIEQVRHGGKFRKMIKKKGPGMNDSLSNNYA